MALPGIKYPSKILSLIVVESGGVNPVEHSIHENVLLQMPYFVTMLSDRWELNGNEKLSFELPPLSNTEDFNVLIQSLYRGAPSSSTHEVERAVGMLVLVKMLQAEQLMEIALQNIRDLAAADGVKLKDLIAALEGYSSLEEVSRLLKDTKLTYDDEILANTIRGCQKPFDSALLSAALDSRATFGLGEKDILTVMDYMRTPVPLQKCDRAEVVPFLAIANPEKLGSNEGAEKARAARKGSYKIYPLCLEVNSRFQPLWGVIRPRITREIHFDEAAKIFQGLVSKDVHCLTTRGDGSWSNSRKTYYPGSDTQHTIVSCALSLHADSTDASSPNPLVFALNELLFVGVDMIKSSVLPLEKLILLFDCASPKILDLHASCDDKTCRSLRKLSKTSGIALTDDQLSAFLERAKLELSSAQAVNLAQHLLNSSRWGLEVLGPNATASIQSILSSI